MHNPHLFPTEPENGILFWANWANKAYLANKANKVFKANG